MEEASDRAVRHPVARLCQNGAANKLTVYLRLHKAGAKKVPHRANRCVLFDSKLIHVTDKMRFKPGYENRRVNVTLLYG